MRNPLSPLWLLPRKVIVALIALYQATLSPDHGLLKSLFPYGYCRHSPTCSEYGITVIGRWGVVIGGLFLLRRILSCHPWAHVSDERLRQAIDINANRATMPPCIPSSSQPTQAEPDSRIASPQPTQMSGSQEGIPPKS